MASTCGIESMLVFFVHAARPEMQSTAPYIHTFSRNTNCKKKIERKKSKKRRMSARARNTFITPFNCRRTMYHVNELKWKVKVRWTLVKSFAADREINRELRKILTILFGLWSIYNAECLCQWNLFLWLFVFNADVWFLFGSSGHKARLTDNPGESAANNRQLTNCTPNSTGNHTKNQ